MKKLSAICIAVSMLFTFLAAYSFAEEASLKVTAMNGKVSVKVYPSQAWTEAAPGQILHAKDVISTGTCDVHSKGSEKQFIDEKGDVCHVCGAVTLELPDKSSVSLKPGTEISIDELVMDNAARKLKVNLAKGELRMIITKVGTPSDFSVKTPNAIYGATGTVYYVRVTPTGTSVYVADGSINVINPIDGMTYTVAAGMMMTFNTDGTFTGPVPATDIDVNGWTAHYADPTAEPYTPPLDYGNNLEPPDNTPERAASGG